MNDYFKKAMFMSLGMASLGKAKMEEFAKEYASMYSKSEAEGQKVYEEILKEAEKTKDEMEKKIKESGEEILAKFNLTTLDKLKELEARVAELEKQLSAK